MRKLLYITKLTAYNQTIVTFCTLGGTFTRSQLEGQRPHQDPKPIQPTHIRKR